jgi:excisionase family DNA binding protein
MQPTGLPRASQATLDLAPPVPEQLLSIKQAAAYTGVSQITVRRWIRDQHLPIYRAGRQIRIDKSTIVSFMRTSARE